jgi:diketogulonate reductase-like aldo/keto reductase
MRTVETRTGAHLPILGQGTWGMGEKRREHAREVAALQLGFDLGMTFVDTAEMYGDGGAEEVVGEAIRGRRDAVFVVTKVLPENASRTGTIRAAERSLKRLGSEWIDLYLLHWGGPHPLSDTLEAFEELRQAGKIRHYGVSNLDLRQMEEAEGLAHGSRIATDQVLYNLGRRGIEVDLLPWCTARRIAIMAYSPYDHGRLSRKKVLQEVARRHGCTLSRVALAWVIQHENVMAIPKASDPRHVRDNAAAADLVLTTQDFEELDAAFPAPSQPVPLEML